MPKHSGGVYAGVALGVAAVLAGGWFALGSAFADSGRAGAAAQTVTPLEFEPAVPVPAEELPLSETQPSRAADSRAVQIVDRSWASLTAARSGIPERALIAYAAAELVLASEQPECGIGWNTLAGIGRLESGHGSFGGAVLQSNGDASPQILGPALDGNGFAAIPDTDGGAWDSDTVWDRAVGPMQFIPDTWARWGADGNGDGSSDPNNIDDAALAAGRYLCAGGGMRDAASWRAAVFSYNHLDSYVDSVARAANEYASRAGGGG